MSYGPWSPSLHSSEKVAQLRSLAGLVAAAFSSDHHCVSGLWRAESYGRSAGFASSIIREAVCTAAGKAYSPLFRRPLAPLASSPFDGRLRWVDGRFRWVARRRANIECPRDQALSRSRSAMPLDCFAGQPKLTESRKHHARSPQPTACPTMSVVVSPPWALCSNVASAPTIPRRLGSRPRCYWPFLPSEFDQHWLWFDRYCSSSDLDQW
jgi:hypothetical protein